jgi:hypothetical protein
MSIEAVARLALPEQASKSRFHPLTQRGCYGEESEEEDSEEGQEGEEVQEEVVLQGSGGVLSSARARSGDAQSGPHGPLF